MLCVCRRARAPAGGLRPELAAERTAPGLPQQQRAAGRQPDQAGRAKWPSWRNSHCRGHRYCKQAGAPPSRLCMHHAGASSAHVDFYGPYHTIARSLSMVVCDLMGHWSHRTPTLLRSSPMPPPPRSPRERLPKPSPSPSLRCRFPSP